MKLTPIVVLMAAALATSVQAAGPEHSQRDIKTLSDAAAALSTSNPDLSSKLKAYATKESSEREESENEQAEAPEAQDIQMLRDAASALQSSNPKLAKDVETYADKETREQKGESSEHEQSGEQQAPAQQTPRQGY